MTDGTFNHPAHNKGGHPKGGRLWRVMVVAVFAVMFCGFMSLGIWQVQRLAWKTALIERVDNRIHAAPVDAPTPDVVITQQDHEYLRVKLAGRLRHDLETPVKAVTDLGAGWWILTPLETDQGFTVLVNRGFVPPELKTPDTRPTDDEQVQVTGLLRLSEGNSGFLRENDAATNSWYAREVDAIAKARGINGPVASYFVDAQPTQLDATGADATHSWPRAGLTVIKFANSHLVYALTWFGLALMTCWAMYIVLLRKRS